jgi:hypothetical protein
VEQLELSGEIVDEGHGEVGRDVTDQRLFQMHSSEEQQLVRLRWQLSPAGGAQRSANRPPERAFVGQDASQGSEKRSLRRTVLGSVIGFQGGLWLTSRPREPAERTRPPFDNVARRTDEAEPVFGFPGPAREDAPSARGVFAAADAGGVSSALASVAGSSRFGDPSRMPYFAASVP